MRTKPASPSSPTSGRPGRSSSQRPPCATHGLATGPDGRCALCKRAELGSYRPPQDESPSGASRLTTALVGVAALASVGAALAISLGWVQLDWSSPPAEPVARAAAPAALPRSRGYAAELPAPSPPAAQLAAAPAAAADVAPPPAVPPPVVSDVRAIAEQERKLKEEAERDRKRREQIEADMAQRALKRARADVTVVMYSTTWCPTCTKARDYLTQNAIPFVDHDIDASESAKEANRRLNPKGSIPTIDVDGEVMVGFSGSRLERMIEAAAKKRVR